jgi:uncharacterized RmlC-like cupin family protein
MGHGFGVVSGGLAPQQRGPVPPSVDGPGDGCVVIRSDDTYDGKQGVTLSTGISRTSAGSLGLCMHIVTLPPGRRGSPHVHDGHESAIWIAAGEAEVWHGPGLASRTVIGAGDFLYIPPGTPHLPVNRSQTDTMTSVVARTDPAEQESVVVMDLPPHLADLRDMPVAAG